MDEKRPSDSTLGELIQTLLDNPVINQALNAAGGARDLATNAQTQALRNLNVATAADLDRLARRLRSLSDRLEEVEDQLDRLTRDVTAHRAEPSASRPDDSLDQARLGEERLGLSE